MSRLYALVLVFIGSLISAAASDYEGKVGKMKAVYSLDWHDDGSVTGTYSYPARPGVTYTLRGENPREGELSLSEYTGGELTARCLLRKRVEEGAIVWEGEMHNTDGRRFPMSLSRAREMPASSTAVDPYEKERETILKAIRPTYQWDDFPLSEEIVEMVPVHFERSHHLNGRLTAYRSDASSVVLTFVVGKWDGEELVRYEGGPEVTLKMARSLPVTPADIIGNNLSAVFSSDGSLLSVDLCSILVTHARKSAGGKLQVRGALDFWTDGETGEGTAAKMPVIEFLPDKLALFEKGDPSTDEHFFQSIRLVKDYGITIQATDAGSGSLELESLSLDAASENPWITIDAPALVAPPSQRTGQAG